MTKTDTDKTYYVVRTKRSGKFIRAFINESQASSWCDRHAEWFWRTEQMHEPNADGKVFQIKWPQD